MQCREHWRLGPVSKALNYHLISIGMVVFLVALLLFQVIPDFDPAVVSDSPELSMGRSSLDSTESATTNYSSGSSSSHSVGAKLWCQRRVAVLYCIMMMHQPCPLLLMYARRSRKLLRIVPSRMHRRRQRLRPSAGIALSAACFINVSNNQDVPRIFIYLFSMTHNILTNTHALTHAHRLLSVIHEISQRDNIVLRY